MSLDDSHHDIHSDDLFYRQRGLASHWTVTREYGRWIVIDENGESLNCSFDSEREARVAVELARAAAERHEAFNRSREEGLFSE